MDTITITYNQDEVYSSDSQFDIDLNVTGKTLSDDITIKWSGVGSFEETNWQNISRIAQAGLAADYWAVGDTKAVTLNGMISDCTFSNETFYAFIIGFDHNSALEGNNRIHLQFGKTALSDGKDISFNDSKTGVVVSTTGYFNMNSSNTTVGGWSSSQMRNTICGTNLSSYSGTFIAVLPSELRSVLKTVTKYTDNIGNGSTAAANVTTTTDVIFLLSEWEVFGARTYANSAEKNYQAQYAYYSAGNSKIKYWHTNMSIAAYWWLRSPRASSATAFTAVSGTGAMSYLNAYSSRCFAPGFCV